jgi:small subunit ribosomal protein S6
LLNYRHSNLPNVRATGVWLNPKEVKLPSQTTTNEYELVVLFRPELEDKLDVATQTVADIIKKNDGVIVAEEDWGRKELAYQIAGESQAVYRLYTLQLPTSAPAKISTALNINQSLLRYLLTKVDPKVKAALSEEKSRRAENTETEKQSEE